MNDQKNMETLVFIQQFIKTHGYPPSRQEIGDGLGGLAKSTSHYRLQRLVDSGLIEVDSNIDRGVRITRSGMVALLETL